MPRHILAPAAVACDICIVRRSAHPRGAFLCNRNEVSYYTKKLYRRYILPRHSKILAFYRYFGNEVLYFSNSFPQDTASLCSE